MPMGFKPISSISGSVSVRVKILPLFDVYIEQRQIEEKIRVRSSVNEPFVNPNGSRGLLESHDYSRSTLLTGYRIRKCATHNDYNTYIGNTSPVRQSTLGYTLAEKIKCCQGYSRTKTSTVEMFSRSRSTVNSHTWSKTCFTQTIFKHTYKPQPFENH